MVFASMSRPGFTQSNFHKELDVKGDRITYQTDPHGARSFTEETAAAVAYLLSPEASSVMGQTLSVSGGD